MAFMMPVMKNDWDIYKSNRSRRTSESSNPQSVRSRKVSEGSGCKSESGSLASPAHRSVPSMLGRTGSGPPHAGARPPRPARSLSCSPPTPQPSSAASSPPDKFHTRLVDKLKRSLLPKHRRAASADDERSS